MSFPSTSYSLSNTLIFCPIFKGWLKNKIKLEVIFERIDHCAKNAIPKTVEQAVRKAKQECVNLFFLDSAFETAKQLHRWGTTPLLVLNDLRKLDLVVQEWRKNAFSSAGLVSYMRDQHGLVYASGIGENTAQKYGADYTAVYLGKPVLLQAHLKRGKRTNITRIYMHVDNANKTIVIGLVVAHGQYGNS